jgi:excisionase family DNA binding protein
MELETLSLQEAADALGVHYMTAYRYVRLGLLGATKEGATWKVPASEIARLLQERVSDDQGRRPGGRSVEPAPWAARLESRLRAGDERGSWGVVEAALSSGTEPSEVYVQLLAPAMRGIGDAWAAGEIDVAVEHRASIIVMRMIGRLGPRFNRRGQTRGSVVLGAPPGDLHGLPTALLADLVRGPASRCRTSVPTHRSSPSCAPPRSPTGSWPSPSVSPPPATSWRCASGMIDALHEDIPVVTVLTGGGR